jgi:hypothetical protein
MRFAHAHIDAPSPPAYHRNSNATKRKIRWRPPES